MGRLLILFSLFLFSFLSIVFFFSISTLLGLVRSLIFFYASGFNFRSFFCMYPSNLHSSPFRKGLFYHLPACASR